MKLIAMFFFCEAHRNVGGARCEQLSIRPVHRPCVPGRCPRIHGFSLFRAKPQATNRGITATPSSSHTSFCRWTKSVDIRRQVDMHLRFGGDVERGHRQRQAARHWRTGGPRRCTLAAAGQGGGGGLVCSGHKGWAAYNTCLRLFCPSTGLSRRVTKHDTARSPGANERLHKTKQSSRLRRLNTARSCCVHEIP